DRSSAKFPEISLSAVVFAYVGFVGQSHGHGRKRQRELERSTIGKKMLLEHTSSPPWSAVCSRPARCWSVSEGSTSPTGHARYVVRAGGGPGGAPLTQPVVPTQTAQRQAAVFHLIEQP